MNDCMTFPDTVEEFMDDYKIIDTEGIYMSKGMELVPIFRMNQWFEHSEPSQLAKDIARILENDQDMRVILKNAESKIVRCKDCKHKPSGDGVNHHITFPDGRCPCQCDDYWYSWIPDDDWFCGNAERREDG